MDTSMYAEMAEMEGNHWWFRGRRAVVLDVMKRHVPHGGKLLDIGLGTGFNAKLFSDMGYAVEGVEPAPEAIAFAKKIVPNVQVHQTMFPADSIPGDTYSVAIMLDTLEHLEDDVAALKEVRRLLVKGGTALFTVPAYQFLWTKHDQRAHHFRRYTKKELTAAFHNAGLEPVFVSYYNFFLFPPIAFVRWVLKVLRSTNSSSDLDKTPGFLNAILAALFSSERYLLRLFPLPFGVSLIAVVRK